VSYEEPTLPLIRLVPPQPQAPPRDSGADLSPSSPQSGPPPERVSRVNALGEPHIGHAPRHDLDSLFRRYSPYVAAIAHRLLGRDDEVDDTIQEVFLAAVRGLHALRDPAAIRAWLARVTVRSARQRLRKRRLRGFLGLDEPTSYEAVIDRGASAEQRALVARLYRVLDSMPANHRIAWSLRYIEGEPLESVASLAGCSLATAKRRIAAAAAHIEGAFADD
jgi:RNA polymerase sigma-70 factor, ECF subfamily